MRFRVALGLIGAGMMVLLSTVPIGVAGTEAAPEISDSPNDIEYHPAEVSHASDYLDILSIWAEYDQGADTIQFWWKAADTTALETPMQDRAINCYAQTNLTVGDELYGTLSFQWATTSTTGSLHGSMSYRPEGDRLATESSTRPTYTFEPLFGSPGYFVWTIDRPYVANRGEMLDAANISCSEGVGVRPPDSFVFALYYNYESAAGRFGWDLTTLRPDRIQGSDEGLPGQTTEIENAGIPVKQAPTFDSVAAALLCLAVALGFRFRHRRQS